MPSLQKSLKRKFKKYTALIPKTVKATKKFTKKISNKSSCFLLKTKKTIKKIPSFVNSKTSKVVRYFSK
jgi:hypothetical protein